VLVTGSGFSALEVSVVDGAYKLMYWHRTSLPGSNAVRFACNILENKKQLAEQRYISVYMRMNLVIVRLQALFKSRQDQVVCCVCEIFNSNET
jgi:hypothetical protein